jgi:hypothetical protein
MLLLQHSAVPAQYWAVVQAPAEGQGGKSSIERGRGVGLSLGSKRHVCLFGCLFSITAKRERTTISPHAQSAGHQGSNDAQPALQHQATNGRLQNHRHCGGRKTDEKQ